MYQNFTDAIKELFDKEKIVLEIGPGLYAAPAASILQNLEPSLYLALDAAFESEDASKNFNQIGGIKEYSEFLITLLGYKPSNLFTICGVAHALPLASKSVDYILLVKTLFKLTDGALNSWEKMKNSLIEKFREIGIDSLTENEYKQLTILAYELLVLEEARRVSKEGIVIIPESKVLEEDLEEELKIYSELAGCQFRSVIVKKPTWSVRLKERNEEIDHWQDNSTYKIYILELEVGNPKPLNKEMLIEYLKRRKATGSSYFKSLCSKLFQAGEA